MGRVCFGGELDSGRGQRDTPPAHMAAHGMKPASIRIASGRTALRCYALAYFFYFSNEGVGAVA